MEKAAQYIRSQYQLIQQSRSVLLGYCKTISEADLTNQNSGFGRGGSIRNLLVHIVNTYEFWIVQHALRQNVVFTEYTSVNAMTEVDELYNQVDRGVFLFFDQYERSLFDTVHLEINGVNKRTSAFELFTHVITHEFHHKGQILSLSRHLGYIPVDTDIIR